MSQSEKRALVLSGGGSLGSYQAGAVHYLLRNLGIDYDIFTGVSVGALNASFLAQFRKGLNIGASLGLSDLWLGIKGNRDVWKHWWFPWISAIWKKSVYTTKPLRKLVEEHINEGMLQNSGKILRVGSVSLTTGGFKVWTEQDPLIKEGVLASSAFPGFFEPVKVGDEWHTDGGVRDVTPLKAAIDAGATKIDVILTNTPGVKKVDFENKKAVHVLIRSLDVIMDEVVENDIKFCYKLNDIAEQTGMPGIRKIDLRIMRPATGLHGDSLDFKPKNIQRNYEQGYEEAQEFFDE